MTGHLGVQAIEVDAAFEWESPEALEDSSPRRSLLEMTLGRAIRDELEHIHGRKLKSPNLHPFATRTLFSGVKLTNRELLLVLDISSGSATGAMADKVKARWLRSPTAARSRELYNLHLFGLRLLRSKRVKNAEVVRGWAFALIHAAALDVLHAVTPAEIELAEGSVGADRKLSHF